MNAMTKEIPVTFTGVDRAGIVPAWARRSEERRSTVSELCRTSTPNGIAILQSSGPRKIIEHNKQISKLFEIYSLKTDFSSRLILGFNKADKDEVLSLAPLLGRYPGLVGRLDLARRADALQDTLLEAIIKILASRAGRDPLADVASVAKVDRSLRATSGRLDARKIASAFGFTPAEIGRQIGVSRQRISKTADGEAIQPLLRPYERIARLRTVLNDADFKAWLHTPNAHLEDEDAPIDYLKAGAREPLASFAENMLTGAST